MGTVDEDVRIEIVGGPFEADADIEVTVGDRSLVDLERRDDRRIEGTLQASLMATVGVQDVRVRVGERFGLIQNALIITRPVNEGSVLNTDAVADEIGPEGNPWRLVSSVVVPAGWAPPCARRDRDRRDRTEPKFDCRR